MIDQWETSTPVRSLAAVRWLVVALACVTFGAYFALIVYCDLTAPEPLGAAVVSSTDGFRVRRVQPGLPIARAGLVENDRVVDIDGRPVRTTLAWTTMIARLAVGQPVSITFEHDGRVQTGSLRFDKSQHQLWSSALGLSLLATRLLQLVPLVLAIVLLTRPTGFNGRLSSWLRRGGQLFRHLPSAYDGPAHGGALIRPARPCSSCGRGIRGSWRAYDYSAEMCVSAWSLLGFNSAQNGGLGALRIVLHQYSKIGRLGSQSCLPNRRSPVYSRFQARF